MLSVVDVAGNWDGIENLDYKWLKSERLWHLDLQKGRYWTASWGQGKMWRKMYKDMGKPTAMLGESDNTRSSHYMMVDVMDRGLPWWNYNVPKMDYWQPFLDTFPPYILRHINTSVTVRNCSVSPRLHNRPWTTHKVKVFDFIAAGKFKLKNGMQATSHKRETK